MTEFAGVPPIGSSPPATSDRAWRVPAGVLPLVVGAVTFAGLLGGVGTRSGAVDFWLLWLVAVIGWYALRDPVTTLGVFCFAVPFEFIFYAWGNGKYHALTYVVAALTVYWVASRRQLFTKLRTHEWLFVILITWSALSLLWLDQPFADIERLLAFAGIGLIFYVFGRAIRNIQGVRRCLWFFVTGLAGLALVLMPYYERSTFVEYYGKLYLSTFGTADEVSHYEFGNACLVGFFGVLGLWEFEPRRFRRQLALACGVLLAGAILLTLSRSLAIELGVASLVWAGLPGHRRRVPQKLSLVAVVLIGGVGLAWTTNPSVLEFRIDTTLAAAEAGDIRALTSGRTHIWEVGQDLFDRAPVTGIGFGQFSRGFAEVTGGPRRGDHNAYLAFLVETGLPGLLLFLAFCGSLGVLAWRTGPWRPVTTAWWTYFMIENALHGFGRNKSFWIAAGLMLALARIEAMRSERGSLDRIPISDGTLPSTVRPG